MTITQGTFGQLPDLDDDEIEAQVRYATDQGWAILIEYTDDPHPRNLFWDLWGLPMFDLTDPRAALLEVNACREAFPGHYVKLSAFDNRNRRETIRLSFLVQRPAEEPGFRLDRQHGPGRTTHYTLHPYAAGQPHGERYQ
ncbi:MAG: ribulose bisphosphate carboxylase small subunit [Acidimicrobiales bacterium]